MTSRFPRAYMIVFPVHTGVNRQAAVQSVVLPEVFPVHTGVNLELRSDVGLLHESSPCTRG